jgi:RNA polymerase sigma factor (sigma-70 family)
MRNKFSPLDKMLALQAMLLVAKRSRKESDRKQLNKAIYLEYFEKAYTYAYYFNRNYAEDIVSEIFLKMMKTDVRYFPDFIDHRFEAYFFIVCTNTAKTFYRLFIRKNADAAFSLPLHDSGINPFEQSAAPAFEAEYYLSLLDDLQQQVFCLQVMGYTQNEIVKILKVKPSYVKNTLNRCRKKIRQLRAKNIAKIHDPGHSNCA